jgi:hypothetical protein
MEAVNSQRDHLQIVAALGPPRRLARHLHRRQDQGHDQANDPNDDEQLN